jgi:hypothetical protein
MSPGQAYSITRQPLIFASLGPTAYELAEEPQLRSAPAYNIIVGELVRRFSQLTPAVITSVESSAPRTTCSDRLSFDSQILTLRISGML